MANDGLNINLRLGGKPEPKPVPPPKIAAKHVENFSDFNFGKKVPQPKIQKIRGQTFRT